jgi:hypothetical protein
MIDLRVLRDLWTEDGARAIFAELVTQCVRSIYPSARAIRPDPGDQGIDTFVGEFEGDLRVYQSKYFCAGIDKAQQAQIRSSWDTCVKSTYFDRVTLWTLCIPIEMSVPEVQWWQKWRKRESEKWQRQIELWSKADFVNFSTRSDLVAVFANALQRGGVKHPNFDAVLSALRAGRADPLVKKLPGRDHLRDAVFVRKIEAAGVSQHRSARTAFYNFELLRAAVEQGGNPDEVAALEDLQERIYDLWEGAYNAHEPDKLGRQLFVAVDKAIEQEDQGRLRTSLPTHILHKKGALHYWADLCEAGWTPDFKQIGREDDEESPK